MRIGVKRHTRSGLIKDFADVDNEIRDGLFGKLSAGLGRGQLGMIVGVLLDLPQRIIAIAATIVAR